jgi:surfeit locus 1 family protein
LLVALAAFAGFMALGTWQLERRAWKLALIARVEARVHAPAAPMQSPSQWASIDPGDDEYRHVRATGRLLRNADTLVQALTERGAGFWVVTPLRLAGGGVVLVNRGFVPSEARDRIMSPADGEAVVTGLLRLTEPGGGFLRRNDAANERWYSRDVQAIGAARRLGTDLAPFFIDADASSPTSTDAHRVAPIGGLTVIAFHNNHLVYAITWYTLALMAAAAAWRVWREERRVAEHD